jgi:hypothetical protein
MVRLSAARLRALANRIEKSVEYVITGHIPPCGCANGEAYREWLRITHALDAAEAKAHPDVRVIEITLAIPRADGGAGGVF